MLSSMRRPRHLVAAALLCLSAACSNPGISQVEIEIHDETPFHVFPPGTEFSFDITATVVADAVPEGLGYQWRNFRGEALGPVVPLTAGERVTVTSPAAAPDVGYYGLAFLPDDRSVSFNESNGSRSEIGFAVLPERQFSDRELDPSSPFGVVHADTDDPHLSTWIKTMTWRTTSARWWNFEMQERRDIGLLELPIVSGDGWTTDDEQPVSSRFLDRFETRIRGYFEADPATRHWELGREENLRSRFGHPYYFANLKAKAAAARRAADSAGAPVRFLYQIGGRSRSNMVSFLESEAAAEFDIIAPHPYAWPDFPTPETWLEEFLDDRRSELIRTGYDFPMWLTEVGAPQNDANVEQMLSGSSPVRGQSREEHAAYLVKFHTIALAKGVEKIFWYNYRDRDESTTDVEAHFGMVDHWGFPKPAYSAYVNMARCLEGKSYLEMKQTDEHIRAYEFAGADESCLVAWVYPADTRADPVSNFEINDRRIIGVTDMVGTPMPASAEIELDEYPVFITVTRDPTSNGR